MPQYVPLIMRGYIAGISGVGRQGRSKGVAGRSPTGNKGETAIFLGLLILGGEGGIRTSECAALYRLTWFCSDTGNKALIRISASVRFYRCVPRANSHGGCSTTK